MSTENETKDYIETLSKCLCGGMRVNLLYSNAEFCLQIPKDSERDIIIHLSRRIVEDFDLALTKYKDQAYFYTMENQLKYTICSELVNKNVTPNLCVSEEMINEKGEWINEEVQNLHVVSFDSRMTKYISDGLKQILDGLDSIRNMHESLILEDFEAYRKDVHSIYEYYREHGNLNDRTSVRSLQILKAAAVCKIILLEVEKKKAKLNRIARALDGEIFYIAAQMHDRLFFRIRIPDFVQSIKELYSEAMNTASKIPENNVGLIEDHDLFDIAFSLAHEQHEYVDDVYSNLKRISPNLKIFYYREEIQEIKSWGKNQFEYFQKIYRDQSKHVIIFISKDYAMKRWARHEWRAVQEAILSRPEEYLLPARFDDTDLPGLHKTISYIDLSTRTPKDFAKMIVEKVGLLKST